MSYLKSYSILQCRVKIGKVNWFERVSVDDLTHRSNCIIYQWTTHVSSDKITLFHAVEKHAFLSICTEANSKDNSEIENFLPHVKTLLLFKPIWKVSHQSNQNSYYLMIKYCKIQPYLHSKDPLFQAKTTHTYCRSFSIWIVEYQICWRCFVSVVHTPCTRSKFCYKTVILPVDCVIRRNKWINLKLNTGNYSTIDLFNIINKF
jgi:hypothetical protein